jgi:outer membrane protein assembly factor BamB
VRIRIAVVGMLAACAAVAAAIALASSTPHLPSLGAVGAFPKLKSTPAWDVKRPDPVLERLGLPPVPRGSKLSGYLMIADRDNNRLIIVNPSKRIVWRFPPAGSHSSTILSEPDDAFVSANGRYISTNQEFNETIKLISLGTHPRIVWRYGHGGAEGSAHGYLAHPDDAYLLADNRIQVADIINCRLLWVNHSEQIVRTIGIPGDCVHDPPRTLSDPNGDTPLPGGGVLVTEIGGWVDRLDSRGRLMWSFRSPTTYPSDAQLTRHGDVLVASYTSPGRVDIISPRGRVLWTYEVTHGRGELNHPSLAVLLPNGRIALNDDFNQRVVVIDPRTKRIVWQYGHDGVSGSGPDYLNNPDGIDLLP